MIQSAINKTFQTIAGVKALHTISPQSDNEIMRAKAEAQSKSKIESLKASKEATETIRKSLILDASGKNIIVNDTKKGVEYGRT